MNKISKDFVIRWFCRNCWQKGIASLNMIPLDGVPDFEPPTEEDIKLMVTISCHTNCSEPEIRLHHDTKKEINQKTDQCSSGRNRQVFRLAGKQNAPETRTANQAHDRQAATLADEP